MREESGLLPSRYIHLKKHINAKSLSYKVVAMFDYVDSVLSPLVDFYFYFLNLGTGLNCRSKIFNIVS